MTAADPTPTSAPEAPAVAAEVAPMVEATYTVAEGAALLRQSERWYLTRLRSGELPGHKAGRSWYLTASDLAEAQVRTKVAAGAPLPDLSALTPRPRSRARHRTPLPR
ncbi:helix-turn-helix domain-containing protein [Nocardia sp. NPDC051570]|uniref:helix-turn-helix domain-containing protein n=1 Tax=Nocardia sp. NPDC051570 TaxID=3364324 RepID=UPI00379B0776